MKKAFLLLFFLLPFVIFGQITVVDGPNIISDIDTQSSTTMYQGTFDAPDSLWDGYPGFKQYLCKFYLQDSTTVVYSLNYPAVPDYAIPALPLTIDIYDEDIEDNTGGVYAQLEPGKTYYLEVSAVSVSGSVVVVDTAQSDGVLILGGTGPSDVTSNENALTVSGNISLSASPSSLLFAAGEESKSLQLRVSTSGTGMISIDSIREDRIYPLWGEDRGFAEGLDLDLPAGSSEKVSRQISMSNLERAKALGSGTEGSFILRYLVSGRDAWGNPVSSTLDIPAAVSGGKAAALDVNDASIQLPDSPYYMGDTVIGSTVTIDADGSGTVVGQVYVDDSLSWSQNPTFTISVNGTTSFELAGPLPTDIEGLHTVRVELISPQGLSVQESYLVSASGSPFPTQPHQSLTLIPDVAELYEIAGSATVNNIDGNEEYTFNGTASLRILSMDNLELPGAEVNDLIVRYDKDSPGKPIITGGTVVREGAGETLAAVAGGYMKIGQIAYNHGTDPDRLTARTNLNIPLLMDEEYLTLNEIGITSDGIELESFSWSKDNPESFTAFGIKFRLHDVGGVQALTILEDPASDRYGFSMSGSIAWKEKQGLAEEERELVSFSGLTFYTDGDFEGGITVTEDFDIIPEMLTITSAGLEIDDDEMAFRLGGNIKNLPYPFEDELFDTTFSLSFDTAGNLKGNIVPIDELSIGGHSLGGDDSSEWDAGAATVDLTYLGLELKIMNGILMRDHSLIQIGADIYLDFLSDNDSTAGQEGNRIGFGSITTDTDGQSTLEGGMEISFGGVVTWPSLDGTASLLSNKSLDLGTVKASLENLSLDCDSGNFAFLFAGSFNLDIEAIEGGISFTNLKVALNGTLGEPTITETDLRIMDFVSVRVNKVNWGSGTISYTEDQTTGEGKDRKPAEGVTTTIEVDSYFEICGAEINIGSEDSSLMSGKFEQLLYYGAGDEVSFILKAAAVEVSGCELTADIKYDRSYLRVAGGIKMQEIEGAVVGKIGYVPDGEPNAGEPTFGLFVMAEGLKTMVAPSIFLDGVGGGVFINPSNEDIDTVLRVSGFNRPELGDDIAEMRPGGAEEPGSFAVMLFAGVYVAEKSLVEGQAMITLTANYFSLDAEVKALEGMLEGNSYFLISWNPLYAEGNNVLEADLFDIFNINGDLSFYAYRDDAWGIMGDVRVSLMGDEMASGSFFIGPPGFMVETSVKTGIDIGLVSGYIQFSGMVWYYVEASPDTWGAWADVEVGGSLLWGLVSAKAGIEGALIGQGRSVLIYSVGRVSFEVCWIEVYSGSIWISISGSGFDGGKGRNDHYDALIDEARNMALAMQKAKEDLQYALNDAKDKLYALTIEQRNDAGLALVERSGWIGQALSLSFAAAEIESWPGGLPPELETISNLLFGEEARTLAQLRTELEQLLRDIDDAYEELDELQGLVLAQLEEYEQIIVEDLPDIRDLASSGNPFQGMQTKTVKVGKKTHNVQVGFSIDQDQVKQQKEELSGMRTGFADYQNVFIEQSELLDTKLRQLDEILFESEQSFSALMKFYNSINSDLVDYSERFIDFQQENVRVFRENLTDIISTNVINDDGFPTEKRTSEVVSQLMTRTAHSLSEAELNNWNNLRVSLINLLLEAQSSEAGDWLVDANIEDAQDLFVKSGLELWWYLPNRGWELSIELSEERIDTAIQFFHESGGAFRNSWGNATVISDTVFDRKADLYCLLYEIYDQLAVYGSGNMGSASNDVTPAVHAQRTIAPVRVNDFVTNPVEKVSGVPVATYFEVKRDELSPYLDFPEITDMNGRLYSNNSYSAFFNGDFEAYHPVGIVEYAMKIGSRGPYEPWRSLGTDQQIVDAYFPEYNDPHGYYFYLRARGAGGLAIERQGDFELEFLDFEEDAGPFISNLDISDNSPPTAPVVSLADTKTSSPYELYAEWGAADYQSGIQRYEYAVGTFSGSEDSVDDGFYIQGFGSALEPVPGIEGFSGSDKVPSDILPWTDAGGRTEVIIKNLDLQHGHEYVVSVRATNGVGLKSTGTSEPILVDLTQPEGLKVTEFIQQTLDKYPNSVKFEFTPAEDPETEVSGHLVALGSSPSSDDIYPWTRIFFDFGRIGNVPVPQGETMYLSIKAVNNVGLESVVSAELEFNYRDTTAPAAPMVVTNPQQSSSDSPWIVIGWNGVEDSESGIVSYSYGISSTNTRDRLAEKSLAEPDILGWVEVDLNEGPYFFDTTLGSGSMMMAASDNEGSNTSNNAAGSSGGEPGGIGTVTVTTPIDTTILDTDYEVVRADINLSGQVYAVVKVTNGAGLSSVSYSLPIIYDQSPPEYADVSAARQQKRNDMLVCLLSAGDQESGIEAYGYSIVRIQAGLNLPWIPTRWVTVNSPLSGDVSIPVRIREFPSPGLEYGREYKVSFWVRNRSGLSLSAGSVVIELVAPDPSNDIKLPDVRRLQ